MLQRILTQSRESPLKLKAKAKVELVESIYSERTEKRNENGGEKKRTKSIVRINAAKRRLKKEAKSVKSTMMIK